MFWARAISVLDGSDTDGIHIVWSPPLPAGYSVKGFDIWRRRSQGEHGVRCHTLTATEHNELEQLFTVVIPGAAVSLVLRATFAMPASLPDEPYDKTRRYSSGFQEGEDGRWTWVTPEIPIDAGMTRRIFGWDRPANLDIGGHPALFAKPTPQVYHIDFENVCQFASVSAASPAFLVIALRNGKAVAASTVSNTPWTVDFRRPLDRISIYTALPLRELRVCRDVRRDSGRWKLIAEGLQVPFAAADGGLGNQADERQRAEDRRLPDELPIDPARFSEVSATANAALKPSDQVAPVHVTLLTRDGPNDPFMDIQPWRYVLALTLDAAWRRSLAFAFLDQSRELRQGEAYDYRIVGHFRRRDLQERFLGFHTVPLGASLPLAFRLASIRFSTDTMTTVEAWPPPPAGALRHLCRKGLPINGEIRLDFGTPIQRIVLEFEPGAGGRLRYEASTTSLILGLPLSLDEGLVPIAPRTELAFTQPVDRLALRGSAFLYGVRIAIVPVGNDPNDLVTDETEIDGVVFEPTKPPKAPTFLGAVNLQTPPAPNQGKRPPSTLGFLVSWLPPPPDPMFPAGLWPDDIGSAPPTEVAGYRLERRRVDTNGDYEPFDVDNEFDGPTTITGGRGLQEKPVTIVSGDDLMRIFPEEPVPTPPVPIFSSIDDVLTSAAKPDGPPPGSQHRYQIFSVDLIGRLSDTPKRGSVVRLEKRVPPPIPVGPSLIPDQVTRPRGVSARAIQATDSDLSPDDQALLGGHDNVVVLEWGWTDLERSQDPYAKEFRIYWRNDTPDQIHGTLNGPATSIGGRYRMTAILSRPVAANQFAGQYLRAGGYPFRVAAHGAGTVITIDFDPSSLDPARIPTAESFTFAAVPNGYDLAAASWSERVAVIPIAAQENYRYVFINRFVVNAGAPRRHGWVGVSAADDQSYIPDTLLPGDVNGGRLGNESSVAAARWSARYKGRPDFVMPVPLADVPEILLPEVPGAEVAHRVDLPGLLNGIPRPAGHRFQVERASALDIFGLISARADGRIRVRLPDGSDQSFVLPFAGDQAEFLAAIKTGEAGRIANKFLMEVAIRYNADLASLWQPVGIVDLLAPIDTVVPNKAERHLYRVRLVDAAGHKSAATALVPMVFRVPSKRAPAAPSRFAYRITDDVVTIDLAIEEAYDIAGVLVFTDVLERNDAADASLTIKADLLRLPNRADLGPGAGVRVRLSDGRLISPTFLPRANAMPQDRELRFEVDIPADYEKRIIIWASTVTRDRVPSPLKGPLSALTAAKPGDVPDLEINSTADADVASWTGDPAIDVTVERSLDGGGTWSRTSPWIPGAAGTYQMIDPPPGQRHYRLRVRTRTGRETVGLPIQA